MKKIVFLAAALMASMFILTSCEKENVAEMVENNATSNVKETHIVLLQKGYVNEDGLVGDMYGDENNPENRFFIFYEQQPQTRQTPRPPKYTGTAAYKKNEYGEKILTCTGEAKDCWLDKNGNACCNTATWERIIKK